MPFFKSFCLWFTISLSAQAGIVNVLSPSVGSPEDGWDTSAKANLQQLSGNENKLTFSLLAGTRWVEGPQQILVKGSADWGQASGSVYSKKAFGHIRWKRGFYCTLTNRTLFNLRVYVLNDCTCGRTQMEQDFYCEQVLPLYAEVLSSEDVLGRLSAD